MGTGGETIARAYVERLGWRVLAMNFRCPQGEIDLIAEETTPEDTILVFVEVKTRRGMAQGSPAAAVDVRKQQKLALVAQAWLAKAGRGGEEPACRFDVAEIRMGSDGLGRLYWHRGAFDVSG